ncbi:MAG: hypothetical protein ABIJ09_20390 [Pseudomonadota bacterium]
MKRALLILATCLIGATALAGTYLEEEQRVSGITGAPPQTMVIKSWYEGDRVKKTLSAADFTFLIDLKTQKVLVVQDAQKTYWEVPPEVYQMMTQASLQAFGVVRNPDGSLTVPRNVFQKTKNRRTIGRWQAYEVNVATQLPNNGKVSIWFAEGVGLNQKDFVQTLRGAMARSTPELERFYDEIAALPGYPVLSAATFDVNGQHVVLTQEVKLAQKRSIPASEFAVPKDYKLVDSPLNARMMGGPAPASAPSKAAPTK